jgi:hypothetical protein
VTTRVVTGPKGRVVRKGQDVQISFWKFTDNNLWEKLLCLSLLRNVSLLKLFAFGNYPLSRTISLRELFAVGIYFVKPIIFLCSRNVSYKELLFIFLCWGTFPIRNYLPLATIYLPLMRNGSFWNRSHFPRENLTINYVFLLKQVVFLCWGMYLLTWIVTLYWGKFL